MVKFTDHIDVALWSYNTARTRRWNRITGQQQRWNEATQRWERAKK